MAGCFHPNRIPQTRWRVWYDDQREAHRQIHAGNDVVDYAFMGSDPNSPDNPWLLDAMQQQIQVIYFLGVSRAAIIPSSDIHRGMAPAAPKGPSLRSERS